MMQASSVLLCCVFLASLTPAAHTQNPPSASSVQLTPYTTPDQSASAGVPSGWKATGSQTTITLTGPQNESITLGRVYIARNAPFQAGQRPGGGADLAMPYNAPLTQKLIAVYQQAYALAGKPVPQIAFTSTTPLQVPSILGQCGRFVANLTGAGDPAKIMGIFCSFPLDSAGAFKNFILVAQAPASTAAQEAPLAQAVFSSYRIPQAMLARKLAPVTAPPPPSSGPGAGMSSTLWGMRQADIMATCMDEGVIREYGPRQLPRECGGLAPNP
ncbi:MAG TPA: hypothetical protein VHE33_12765 [Acidobacteriaceae bacterium]|nr:hypothetical protein [Acidobacteriaceae bacterium]